MKKLILLMAVLLSGCVETPPDTTAYQVVKYTGNIPTEMWICDEIVGMGYNGEILIWYKGETKNVGDDVRLKRLANYQGKEDYTVLISEPNSTY